MKTGAGPAHVVSSAISLTCVASARADLHPDRRGRDPPRVETDPLLRSRMPSVSAMCPPLGNIRISLPGDHCGNVMADVRL